MKNSSVKFHWRNPRFYFLCALAIIWMAPVVYANPYFLRLAIMTFIFSILAMSLNLLIGFTKLISFGHAAFFGIGAYTTGVLSTKMGVPFVFTLPSAVIACIIIAYLFCRLTLKSLKDLYFALASWALCEIVYSIYTNVDYLGGTNGIRGIPEPSLWVFKISSDMSFYYLTLVFAIACLVSIELLLLSRVGRAWIAIRENETVAGVMGIDVFRYRILAFVFSIAWAGVAGNLYAYYETYISPGSFTVWESIILICMVLVGGRQSLIGSAFGAGIFLFFPEILRGIGEYRMIVYGFVLLMVILAKPRGLIPPYFVLDKGERT